MKADTGPIGGSLSHEFVIIADTGESQIYTDKRILDVNFEDIPLNKTSLIDLRNKYENYYAVTDEKFDKKNFEEKIPKEFQIKTKGIEVGHIFYFGDKYSKPMNASVDFNGKKIFVKMGSYGIGVSRLVAAIIEAKYDETNEIMKWPISISPYHCAILPLINKNDNKALNISSKIYKILESKNIDTIIDDTEDSISAKMKKFNLIGVPFQIIIGKNYDESTIEFSEIGSEIRKLNIKNVIEIIKNKIQN